MTIRWIAETRFVLRRRDGTRTPVAVAIGEPRQVGPEEWTCALSLRGLHDDVGPIHAGDPIQALGLALGLARTLLAGLEPAGEVLEYETGGTVPLSAYFHDVPEPSHDDGEIHSARTFPVPRPALFAAFADPAVLATWWGPQGSVNVIEAFDFRPGGEWRFTMRTADGTTYPMHKRFVEVAAPERVVLEHVQAGHHFELHMTFEALDASHTLLDWRMRFESPAEAARIRELVLEANEQNFDRLEAVLRRPDR